MVLVSKDINMRIKARALEPAGEGYFNDKTLENEPALHRRSQYACRLLGQACSRSDGELAAGGLTYYRISGPILPQLLIARFVYLEAPEARRSLYAKVIESPGKTAVLRTLRTTPTRRNSIWA